MSQLPPLPMAGWAIDRDAAARNNPDLLDSLWRDSNTRVLFLDDSLVRFNSHASGAVLLLEPASSGERPDDCYYLGRTTVESLDHDGSELPKGTPILAARFDVVGANPAEWHNLRRTHSALSDLDAGLFSQASALMNWHETHPFCPRCGSPTTVSSAGWARSCPEDNREIFPRTDPAVIVAVTDQQDRILFGSQGNWEDNRWSILAGFVEAGESLVSAAHREIFEEAGIEIFDLDFLGSQPWPYPYSLMFGFSAKANSRIDLRPDGEEIVRLRWFSREELSQNRAQMLLPGRLTIARALIENWYGADLGPDKAGK